jgi:hypothetical protein
MIEEIIGMKGYQESKKQTRNLEDFGIPTNRINRFSNFFKDKWIFNRTIAQEWEQLSWTNLIFFLLHVLLTNSNSANGLF